MHKIKGLYVALQSSFFLDLKIAAENLVIELAVVQDKNFILKWNHSLNLRKIIFMVKMPIKPLIWSNFMSLDLVE